MKLTTFVKNIDELKLAAQANLSEVIINTHELSRIGHMDIAAALHIAGHCKDQNISSILNWDILMTEDDFNKAQKLISQLDLSLFDAIRVQDIGALNYILESTNKPIQLNLEVGNHNLEAVLGWLELAGERVERVILSIEVPKDVLKEWRECIPCEVELLGLGKILLFYSPRKLLSPVSTDQDEIIEALGSSEESPHKGFPIVENRHGTFMFHIKDFCLLENVKELFNMGINYMRADLSDVDFSMINELAPAVRNMDEDALRQIKENYPRAVMQGFYRVNKTDVLFPKLKNSRLLKEDSKFLGLVLEVIKRKQILIQIKDGESSLSLGDQIELVTPEGKRFELKVEKMTSSSGEDVLSATSGQIVMIPCRMSIVAKTIVNRL